MSRKDMIKFCDDRMTMGEKKHGTWNAETDKRDLLLEMKEELSDFVNYGLMLMEKIELLRKYLDKKVKL